MQHRRNIDNQCHQRIRKQYIKLKLPTSKPHHRDGKMVFYLRDGTTIVSGIAEEREEIFYERFKPSVSNPEGPD
jgi:hypothetical protein